MFWRNQKELDQIGVMQTVIVDDSNQADKREMKRGAAMVMWMHENHVTKYSDLLTEAAQRFKDGEPGWFESLTKPAYCYNVSAQKIARSYLNGTSAVEAH